MCLLKLRRTKHFIVSDAHYTRCVFHSLLKRIPSPSFAEQLALVPVVMVEVVVPLTLVLTLTLLLVRV